MGRLLHMLGFGAALLLASCRALVLEDRGRCPVNLGFDITNADAFPPEERLFIAVFGSSEEQPAAMDNTSLRAVQEGSFEFSLLPEDAWSGYGMLGMERCRLEAPARWIIEEGRDADPLFRFDFQAERFEGSAVVPVELVKDHARVLLRFLNYQRFGAPDGVFPFEVVLQGNSCGVDGLTGVPLQGPFRHQPAEEEAGCFRFILPRQADDSLCMEIWAKPGLTEREGLVDRFNLGSLFGQLGNMNWEAKNLPDLELTLDYGEASLRIKVLDWEEADPISYEL